MIEQGRDWRVTSTRPDDCIYVVVDDGCAGYALLDQVEATALLDALRRVIREKWGHDDA